MRPLYHSKAQNKLSLCMIIKDEEEYLPRCLDSVKALVDEIIIVDTGSTDRTVEIAKTYGASIYHHPWEDDYSKHRNQSISYAGGDWILIMDADEVIAARDLDKIRQILNSIKAAGFMFTLRNYESNSNLANLTMNPNDYEEGKVYPGFIPSDLIRLFKNDPGIYFAGKVHETVTESFQQTKKIVYNTGIPIHHYGKVRNDRVSQKQEIYLKMGEDNIRENPHDPIAYKGLADQYLELGMPDKALEVINQGVALFPEIVELHFNRGLALDRLRRANEAKKEYLWVLEHKPDHLGACHNLGQIYFSENQFGKTIELLSRGIDLGLRHPAVFFLLGRAFDAAGNWERALMNLSRLLEIQPDYPNANYYKAIIFLNRKMYDSALDALEREIEIGGNQVGAYNTLGKMSLMAKDIKSATQFFQKALTINSDDPNAKFHLAQLGYT